jgi:putative ABC transport system permease protein
MGNQHGSSIFGLRQILVIGQFSFAIILIASTLTIYKQLQFIKNRPLGYNSKGLIEIPHEGLLYEKYDLLKSKLLASGAVVNVTQSSNSITKKESSIRGLEWEGMNESDKIIDFDQIYTTSDFIKTTGIRLLQGRDFNRKFASDTAALMLNEKAVQVMNLKNPVGAKVLYQGAYRTVTGVFSDIVWGKQSKNIAPMVIAYAKDISETITMRLNPQKSTAENLLIISSIIKELNPNFPVDIKYVENLNEEKLKTEATMGKISNVFGGLSIFISCMGLFGLSAFIAEQRTKEVGIRKVLGANVRQLMSMLSLNFIKLVLVAIVIGLPVSGYIMSKWLQTYDIRTNIGYGIFLSTALFTLFLALFTVSWQTYKAAVANPINALKQE